MAGIRWDVDASDGGQELASPRPTPADRFWAFVPDVSILGPRRETVGDGEEYVYELRAERYDAHFEIRHLAPSQLALALALKLWLLRRGEVTVVTDDVDGAEYEGLKLKPGTTPEIVNDDDVRQHFTFRCDLRSASAILVNYDE